MTGTTALDATIDERIRFWLAEGFRLTVQTPSTAQLVRPRRFNPAEFIAMPLYLIEYLSQREQAVYLSSAGGQLTETTAGMDPSAYRRAQARSGSQRVAIAVVALVFIVLALFAAGQLLRGFG